MMYSSEDSPHRRWLPVGSPANGGSFPCAGWRLAADGWSEAGLVDGAGARGFRSPSSSPTWPVLHRGCREAGGRARSGAAIGLQQTFLSAADLVAPTTFAMMLHHGSRPRRLRARGAQPARGLRAAQSVSRAKTLNVGLPTGSSWNSGLTQPSSSACVERACPFMYAYEEFGHTYIGCMQRVYAVEIDLEMLREAEARHEGFGAMRTTRAPLPMCRVEVEECYGEDGRASSAVSTPSSTSSR